MTVAMVGMALFAIGCLLGFAGAWFHSEELVIFSNVNLRVLIIILMGGGAVIMSAGLIKELGRTQ